jgi:hypothetical protein
MENPASREAFFSSFQNMKVFIIFFFRRISGSGSGSKDSIESGSSQCLSVLTTPTVILFFCSHILETQEKKRWQFSCLVSLLSIPQNCLDAFNIFLIVFSGRSLQLRKYSYFVAKVFFNLSVMFMGFNSLQH